MATPDDIRSTIRRYVERHSAGDIDGILSCFRPDAVVSDPVGTDPHVGTDALRAFFTGTHELADRLDLELTGPVRVAAPWAAFPMSATTHLGDGGLVVDIIDVMRFDDDARIAEMTAYWSFDDTRPLDG